VPELGRSPITRNSKRAASEQEASSYQQEGPQDQPPPSRQDPFQQLGELLNLSLLSGGLEAPAFGELPCQYPCGEQAAQGTEVGNYIALYERFFV
jgi:hypothetical protein